VETVETRLVRPPTRILDRPASLRYHVIAPDAGKQISLDLDAIPPACVQATLATEDSRFWLHPGVDPIAIARAAWQNLRSQGIASGASTLTQQLARTLLMDPDERYQQSYKRKLREAWLAAQLERRYTKEELLALYLNQTYYGNFAFGLEAAAQIFFAKPAPQLSKAECALLAGLIQYPGGYNPLSQPETAKARQQTVLRLMEEAGYIDAQERATIDAEPLRYRSRLFDIEAPHFVMYVQDLLARELGPDRLRDGGLTVVTTLDLDLQRQVEASVRRRLDLLNCREPGLCDEFTDRDRRVDNAAAVVLDAQTGEILSMVGSPDYFDAAIQGNVNAALSLRQPGSAIKPFTYAAAMDPRLSAQRAQDPLTPATIIADLPVTFYVKNEDGRTAPYEPLNYDRTFHGPVSVRTALASSYNIPAVKVLDRIGVDALRDLATRAGITTFTGDYGLALTLGGGEVRLLDLTAAFGIFEEGRRVEPRAILKIEDSGLKIGDPELAGRAEISATQSSILNPQFTAPITDPIITPSTAYLITDILSDPVARMPAFGEGSVLDLPFPAAVKTGTTTDWRDNWTVGYSPERLVGVWVGNADNAPMVGVSGVDGAGPIWHDVMLAAHQRPPSPFPRPDEIIDVAICGPSGLLPTDDCPRVRTERFIRGTEPTEPDDQFRRVAMDRITGLPATEATPPEQRESRVYWFLPPEYHDWMVSQGIPLPPPMPAAQASASDASPAAALILAAPADLAEYQLHPGRPLASQRIDVHGYAGDGRAWASLRLVVDGQVLAAGEERASLRAWWPLEPGEHRLWLEGEEVASGETVRSAAARVTVHAAGEFEENVSGKR
jgi:penicillin-binding protein 1C